MQMVFRLIHEDDLGLERQASRDAEALLLAARERAARQVERVLHVVPEGRLPEDLLGETVWVGRCDPAEPQSREHVVADAHGRERVRLLEDHPDAPSYAHGIDLAAEDAGAVEEDLALRSRARNHLVHPVQAADERGFTATRRADHSRDLVLDERQRDVLERALLAEPGREALGAHLLHAGGREGRRRCTSGGGHAAFGPRSTRRAARFRTTTIATSTSAAAQACACQSS